ncbi:hypothetical protein RJ641_027607 [Dillenia turbinata]|uniref:Uncharacterized protein n=1 Tax=Dillenia turbinata TaxID=194707 RepID=A0AAN8VXK7_9MAGN
MEAERDSPSLKQKLKSSFRLPCFSPQHHHDSSVDLQPRLLRSLSWIRSRTHESPEFRVKDKRRHFIPRLGVGHRRRSVSTDFSYDPLSYALNFDDGSFDDSYVDEIPLRKYNVGRTKVIKACQNNKKATMLTPLPHVYKRTWATERPE